MRPNPQRLARSAALRLYRSPIGARIVGLLDDPRAARLRSPAEQVLRRLRGGTAADPAANRLAAFTSLYPSPGRIGLTATEGLPLISIVTPNFNQGAFLEDCLRSILEQDYPNVELIVMDGGSTDNSVEILERYSDRLTFWVSEKDGGQADAINKGLARCRGPIFNWINADDRVAPGALAAVAEAYLAAPDKAGWVGGCFRTEGDDRVVDIIYPNGVERDHIGENWNGKQFYQPSCYLSTEKVKAIGGLDPNLYIALDVDLWLRVLELGELAIGRGIWSVAINHDDAKTQKAVDRMFTEMPELQERFGYPAGAAARRRFLTDRRVDYVVPAALRAAVETAAPGTSADAVVRREGRRNLCLLGDFTTAADVAAVAFFMTDVLPVIQRRHWVELDVIGTGAGSVRVPSANVRLHDVSAAAASATLDALLARSLVLVRPSVEPGGLSGVLAHAARAGLPIVATPLGAAGFDVRDGIDGFLAEDALELGEKCNQVLDDPFCWSNFALRSRLLARADHAPGR